MVEICTKKLVEDITVRNIQYAYETGTINFSEALRMLQMVIAQHKADFQQGEAGLKTLEGREDEDV